MKIWCSYGSEHSMNLVMIGHFKEFSDARKVKEIFEQVRDKVNEEVESKEMEIGDGAGRFSDGMLNFLRERKLYDLSRSEIEQFAYDFNIQLSGCDLVLTTDESDVSAFFKIMIGREARVETYSAHDYEQTGYGR